MGAHAVRTRPAGGMDHGRGPRPLRHRPGRPARRGGHGHPPRLLSRAMRLACGAPVAGARGLLALAARLPQAQPAADPAGDRRPRSRRRSPRANQPARSPPVPDVHGPPRQAWSMTSDATSTALDFTGYQEAAARTAGLVATD